MLKCQGARNFAYGATSTSYLTPVGSSLGVRLNTIPHTRQRLRMSGDKPPLYHIPSRRARRELRKMWTCVHLYYGETMFETKSEHFIGIF